jgi:hypothetical protein
MKQKIKAVYYHAYWDGNFDNKDRFVEACKLFKIPFELIDCESQAGVKASIKNEVRMLPTVIFYNKGGKEIGRCKGNYAYSEIENYL